MSGPPVACWAECVAGSARWSVQHARLQTASANRLQTDLIPPQKKTVGRAISHATSDNAAHLPGHTPLSQLNAEQMDLMAGPGVVGVESKKKGDDDDDELAGLKTAEGAGGAKKEKKEKAKAAAAGEGAAQCAAGGAAGGEEAV